MREGREGAPASPFSKILRVSLEFGAEEARARKATVQKNVGGPAREDLRGRAKEWATDGLSATMGLFG